MLKALLLLLGLLSGVPGKELCQPGQQGRSAQEWRDHYAVAQYDRYLGETYDSVLRDREAKAAQEEFEEQAVADSVEELAAQFAADHFISDLHGCSFNGGARLSSTVGAYTKKHDINQPGTKGKTPLMAVCEIGVWARFLETMLEAGAKVSIKDDYGKTALDYARDYMLENMSASIWEHSSIKEILEKALAQESGN